MKTIKDKSLITLNQKLSVQNFCIYKNLVGQVEHQEFYRLDYYKLLYEKHIRENLVYTLYLQEPNLRILVAI